MTALTYTREIGLAARISEYVTQHIGDREFTTAEVQAIFGPSTRCAMQRACPQNRYYRGRDPLFVWNGLRGRQSRWKLYMSVERKAA